MRWFPVLVSLAIRRRFASAAVAILTMLTLTACDPLGESNLIDTGIGTTLYSADVPKESQLQDLYLRHMCVQAGLGHYGEDNEPICDRPGPNGWAIVVRAGFNDIDRRCDAYLAWLNSKRRTNKAVLTQLSQSSTAAQSIMRIAGATADPIALAGLAFGVARDSFTNYYSRLLLEVESSTVESVVTENQFKFRAALKDKAIQFRPDAVYILRSYLLICSPHVIENNINTRTRFSVANNLPAPQDNDGAQVSESLLSRGRLNLTRQSLQGGTPEKNAQGTRTRTVVVKEREIIKLRDEPKVTGANGVVPNPFERVLPATLGKTLNANLCLPARGQISQATRNAIRLAKLSANSYDTISQLKPSFSDVSGELSSPNEVQYFMDAELCRLDRSGAPRGYENVFEKFGLPTKEAIVELQQQIMSCENSLGATASPIRTSAIKLTGKFDSTTRRSIKFLKLNLRSRNNYVSEPADQIGQTSLPFIRTCR